MSRGPGEQVWSCSLRNVYPTVDNVVGYGHGPWPEGLDMAYRNWMTKILGTDF